MVVNITQESKAVSGMEFLYIQMRSLVGWIKKDYVKDLKSYEEPRSENSEGDPCQAHVEPSMSAAVSLTHRFPFHPCVSTAFRERSG